MKLSISFIAGVLLFCINTRAQDSTASRLRIGSTASIDYSSYQYYVQNELMEPGAMFAFERPGVGLSGGIICAYSLDPNYSLTCGIRFTEHNIVSGPLDLFTINGTIGTVKFTYHTRYIDIPLGFQYNPNQTKNIFFIANAAITPGYVIGEWIELDFEGDDTLGIVDQTTKSTSTELNRFSLKAEVYTGIGMNAGRFQLQFLPQARYSFFKAANNTPINRRYWSAGIDLRLLYSF